MNGYIRTTAEHPFWTPRGWVEAAQLRAGDILLLMASADGAVESVHTTGVRQTVYNIEVSESHTYFVGVFGTLVHNACNVTSRPITPSDVGLEGASLDSLRGTVLDAGSTRIVTLDMIAGKGGKLDSRAIYGALPKAIDNARASGVTTLQFQGSFANDDFERVLKRLAEKAGAQFSSSNGVETITVKVK